MTRLTAAALVTLAACTPKPPITCTDCDGVCTDLRVDSSHCGACGVRCGPGTVCGAGACVASCSATESPCDGGCFDLQTDPRSCGVCGRSCPSGFCLNGTCQTVQSCLPPRAECSGACTDTGSSNLNCGGCGNACDAGYCVAGGCQPTCPAPRSACSGSCVDTKTDPSNCGACGVGCGAGFCRDGGCEPACTAPLTACGGACTDTRSDPAACGACGRGCDGGYCVAGACRPTCPAPLTQCGARCVDTTVDPSNCGACDAGCANTSCVASVCTGTCAPGFLDCDGLAANGCESEEGCIVPITVARSGLLLNDPAVVVMQTMNPFPGEPMRTADLSDDGTVVAFVSASPDVTAGDVNGVADVFVRDLATGVTTNITQGANGPSSRVAVSGNGRFIAFVTLASNLGPVDTWQQDIYVYDRVAGGFDKVTRATDGGSPNGGGIDSVDLSFDGTQVIFASTATDLVAPPASAPNNVHKVYRVDRTTRRVTLLAQPSGAPPCVQDSFYFPRASDDGLVVAWDTSRRLLPQDQNALLDVYVSLPDAGVLLASLKADGGAAENTACVTAATRSDVSGNGRYVTFHGDEDLVGIADPQNDIFVRDLVGATTTQVSVRTDGGTAGGENGFPSIDRSGNRITFVTSAMEITSPALPTAEARCVMAQRAGGATLRTIPIAVMLPGEYPTCFGARISGNGHAVLFATRTGLSLRDVPEPSDGGGMDLYLRLIP